MPVNFKSSFKCYAPGTRIDKKAIDSFLAASSRKEFATDYGRIFVDTGTDWNDNALAMIHNAHPRCQLLQSDYLAQVRVQWPNLAARQKASALRTMPRNEARKYQQEAVQFVRDGFAESNAGKLIMACGTGKTFTALRIAEDLVGAGGRVLYLVPSISLLQQTMREWAEQRAIPHRYIGICSDATAGRRGEDTSGLLEELEIPVSTDAGKIAGKLRSDAPGSEAFLRVAFCTYQSLPLAIAAQDAGAPEFDLVIADEAHRTTGIERPAAVDAATGRSAGVSPFLLVHDGERLRAAKRLFMTATPRIFTGTAKGEAKESNHGIFSMDGPEYGEEFYRMPFSEAVEQGWLADYKVIILSVEESVSPESLKRHLAADRKELHISEKARIIGCWQALRDPECVARNSVFASKNALKKALVFTDTIRSSRRYAKFWGQVIEEAVRQGEDFAPGAGFRCTLDHADGKQNATVRKRKLAWLGGKGDWDGTGLGEDDRDGPAMLPPAEEADGGSGSCRVLANARCLSEGIDVPALDAVIFLSPKRSQVDIVQAVGRVMRKAEGKGEGYVILPVAVPPGVEAKETLDRNEPYGPVWNVLKALRSHDDRFDIEVNSGKLRDRIIVWPRPGNGEPPEGGWLDFPPLELDPNVIYAKIVDECGDRHYWAKWAKDVGEIFQHLQERVSGLLGDTANETLREWFDAFLASLKELINESITRETAIDIMAQHILTKPVFEALFEDYDFNGRNPVARSLQKLTEDFAEFGLQDETKDLAPFYESVQKRARALESAEDRQKLLMELYENFFATALPKDAERLGIVYTPTEVVDFILRSADAALREEFGRGLTDEDVHVLDPFTGSGIFIVRLLEKSLGLLQDVDLDRKYRAELHANEIVLLAYYIACIHVEEAYHGRRGGKYKPFEGIVLTDTFMLPAGKGKQREFPEAREWLPVNSERAERQQKLPIQVIVGNPPWSAGQRSSADDNPNVDYPPLEARVAETYAARSTATNKNSLYDTYKMAIRWASDRIDEQGVIALVTNGSWIDGHADSGIRACLAEEFTSIHVLNLRGNQRTQGERSRKEGGKVFGQGSRAPVAITILVKNPDARHEGCRIRYRDIGDYLKRETKLSQLDEWGSIDGIDDWQQITPDQHHDWINQRDPAFAGLYPIGSKEAKAGKADDAIFQLFSNGYKTGRDAYTYSFSREACAENARGMVDNYRAALEELRNSSGNSDIDSIVRRHSSKLRWDREVKNNLRRGKAVEYSPDRVWKTAYRPFVKQFCYVDYTLANSKHQMDRIFPAADTENRAICVPGIGSTQPFSALMVNAMPDLGFVSACQCFPRYRFPKPDTGEGALPGIEPQAKRIDNISDTALAAFRAHYKDESIDKDDIFDYIYGVLHSPAYRERFAANLAKELPRIPFAADFHAFAQAGRELAALHLGYETCDEYPLEVIAPGGEPTPDHCRLYRSKMKLTDENSALHVNEDLKLTGIPPSAHGYEVNGRSPLGWFIDRYHIATDKHSKIVNDPNGWFEDDPLELIAAICRIVHVSVETARIVAELPDSADTRGEQGRDVELTIGGAEAAASGARPPLAVTDAAGVSSSVPGEKLEASD